MKMPTGYRRPFIASFKNKILLGALLVLIGGVLVIGAMLQIFVFPSLRGDSSVIKHIKLIHFVSSIVVIIISWLFIEMISKKITSPLKELTQRADQISREAGRRNGVERHSRGDSGGYAAMDISQMGALNDGDEITQLKLSFYRMLAHLKSSEIRLRKSEEKYRFLFNNAPNPIFVVDSQTRSILDTNDRAEEVYQYTREEILNMSFLDLTSPDDMDVAERIITKPDPGDLSEPPTLRHMRKDNTSFLVYLQPHISWIADRPAMIIAVWDVTEKLEQDAKMVQTGKMATLGEMATGIAHELNQPLNVIGLASDYLKKGLAKDKPLAREDLEYVSSELTSNVKRAASIINHLRQFGHSAQETMGLMDINSPVIGLKTLFATQLEKKGINLMLELSEDGPQILGDSNRLEQVLMNLALNARDAMLESGSKSNGLGNRNNAIFIRTYAQEDKAVIIVADNGPGISNQIKPKIFDPFFTTKKVGEGTGIGLSISYGIVKEHKGAFEVKDREGGGAEFKLSFPLFSQPMENDHG